MKKILYIAVITMLAFVYACGDASKGSTTKFDNLPLDVTYEELRNELTSRYNCESLQYMDIRINVDDKEDYACGFISGLVNGEPCYFIFLPDETGTKHYKEYFTTDKLDPDAAADTIYAALKAGMTVNEYLAQESADNKPLSQNELKAQYEAVNEAGYPKELDSFVTPDLKFCEVRGHVKEIRQGAEVIAQFDKNGNLTKFVFGDDKSPRFKRNAQGQIVEVAYDRAAAKDGEATMTVKYDKNGYYTEWYDDMDGETTFNHDANGLRREHEWLYKGEYRYTRFDDHGNYLEAVAKIIQDEGDAEYVKTERTIIYY